MKGAALFEGTLLADGLLIESWLPGGGLAMRVLEATSAGGRAFRAGEDVLIVFAAPRRLRVARCGGTPLVRRGQNLVGFLGDASTLEGHVQALVTLRAGEVVATEIASLPPVRASELIIAPALHVHDTRSLGAPPARVAVPRDSSASVRDLFGVPPAERTRALFEATEKKALRASLSEGFFARIGAFLAKGLGALLRSREGGRAGHADASAGAGGARAGAPGKALALPKRSWLDDMLDALKRKLVLFERLTGRQARYLSELLDELDRGDVERAIRHAIPLGAGKGNDRARISLGVPSMRAELRIVPQAGGDASVMPMHDDVQRALREGYERAFRALDARGNHKDAAFVLAELLRDYPRAVDYLEKHARYDLAAEIAEAHDMEAGRIVALFFLAGNDARAIALARRVSAYMQAIAHLERLGDKARGEMLRLEYADRLAEAGNVLAAVEVIWPVEKGRRLAVTWLEHAIEAGGLSAARAWPKYLSLVATNESKLEKELLPALIDESEDGAQFRSMFATLSLSPEVKLPEIGKRALKLVYRGMLDDRRRFPLDSSALIPRVLERLGDGVITADAPTLSRAAPAPVRSHMTLGALDVGTHAIHDAVELPDGRFLVALGELGARIVGRSGKTETCFQQPATGIVIDAARQRAILIAKRADGVRLARVDLTTRRAAHWLDLPCTIIAGDFDGDRLFLARHDAEGASLLCIDAIADEVEVLYAVTGLRGGILDISVTPSALRLLLGPTADDAPSFPLGLMLFELPSRTLRAQRIATASDIVQGFGNAIRGLARGVSAGPSPLGFDHTTARALVFDPETGVVAEDRTAVSENAGPSVPVVTLVGAQRVRMRMHDTTITIADDCGRIVVLDRATLACRRAVRLI